MALFKIHFSQDNIRRIRLDDVPTYAEFTALLESLYPNFHVELALKYMDEDGDKISIESQIEWEGMIDCMAHENVFRLFVEESKVPYFKDGPLPELVKFYDDCINKVSVEVPYATEIQNNVTECLASLFNGGKIIPNHIPEFLKGAVDVKYLEENVADIDIKVHKLFDLLHDKGIEMLGSNRVEDLRKGKDYFLATLNLVPNHVTSLYNLACAESLLGNVSESVAILENAIYNGFNNFEHMIKDEDLLNIRDSQEYKNLMAKLFGTQDEAQEPIPEPTPEPQETFDLSASVLPLVDTFGYQLELLKNMGFTDDTDVLLLLLEQYDGSVENVTQFLLGYN
jgi:hypothetical protein